MENEFRFLKNVLTIEDVFNEVNTYFFAEAQAVFKIADYYKERAEKCGCKQCRRDYRRFMEEKALEWKFDKWEGQPEVRKIPVRYGKS